MHDAVDPAAVAAAAAAGGGGTTPATTPGGGSGGDGGYQPPHLVVPVGTSDATGETNKDPGWVAGAAKNFKEWAGVSGKKAEGREIELGGAGSGGLPSLLAPAATAGGFSDGWSPGDDTGVSGLPTPAKHRERSRGSPADLDKLKRAASGEPQPLCSFIHSFIHSFIVVLTHNPSALPSLGDAGWPILIAPAKHICC
jgi:hypothetical protein